MEQIIVSLSEAAGGQDLAKTIREEQMSGNFDSLFQYMLRNEEDDLNPAYKEDKLQTLNALQRAYDMNKTSNQMELTYISAVDNNPHKVKLTDIVKEQDGILHEGDELFQDMAVDYKQIELCCSYDPAGGN